MKGAHGFIIENRPGFKRKFTGNVARLQFEREKTPNVFSSPGKRRSRQCEVLVYFSEYATTQELDHEPALPMQHLVKSLGVISIREGPNS